MPTTLPPQRTSRTSEILRAVGPRAWYFAAAYAFFALFLRFAPLPDNFATFGALAFFCGLCLRGPERWAFPLAVLLVADSLGHFLQLPGMGFYHVPTMIWNYLGLAVFAAVGSGTGWLWSRNGQSGSASMATLPLAAATGSFSFYLISNFGAWLDPQMAYDRSLSGLLQCYLMGLPFFRWSLVSDLCFGVGFVAFAWATSLWLASRTQSHPTR